MKITQDKNLLNLPENTGISRDEEGKFIKGVSGNPAGKPPGSLSITALIKKELEVIPEGQKLTYAQAMIKKMLHKAIIEGDHSTEKMIWNYIDGLPKESIEHSGNISVTPIYGGQSKDVF